MIRRSAHGASPAWALAPALFLLLAVAAVVAVCAVALDAPAREAVVAALSPLAALLGATGFVLSLLAGWLLHRLAHARTGAVNGWRARLRGHVARHPDGVTRSDAPDSVDALIDTLAAQRDALAADVEARVARASRDIDAERRRLATLMSELAQSVVVCSLDGRVILYNNRARLQFRALSAQSAVTGGAEVLGIGRSIYGALDPRLVRHALDDIAHRIGRGAAHPLAQFVTHTRAGQLLRVQVAPVRTADVPGDTAVAAAVHTATAAAATVDETTVDEAADATLAATAADASTGAPPALPGLDGFVLMIENLTREFDEIAARDQAMHELAEQARITVAELARAASHADTDTDTAFDPGPGTHAVPDAGPSSWRRRLADASRHIDTLAAEVRHAMRTRWPLEDMLASDLLDAAVTRLQGVDGLQVRASAPDDAVWLRVDSYSLLHAVRHVAVRLRDEYGHRRLRLRIEPVEAPVQSGTSATSSPSPAPAPDVQPAARHAWLHVDWDGAPVSAETLAQWQHEPIGDEHGGIGLTLHDVAGRHGSELLATRETATQRASLSMLLPAARAHGPASAGGTSAARPESYDFGLLDPAHRLHALPQPARLAALQYTVFDTETTGLQPSGGDEIVQIGATRIVNGRLLRAESFEQLVDPKRLIPAAAVAIHGIDAARVRGQPDILQVLPAFHAFGAGTVLVAHNAAFDMRFLQMKEAASGLRFDQPVLDTLLLSGVTDPEADSHDLAAIAARLGVPVPGRHTALGDALVTADVFLRLLPRLAARGIVTLDDALDASRRVWHARLRY